MTRVFSIFASEPLYCHYSYMYTLSMYSVMYSDGNSFCGDVVLDSFNMASRDVDSIFKQIYTYKVNMVWFLLWWFFLKWYYTERHINIRVELSIYKLRKFNIKVSLCNLKCNPLPKTATGLKNWRTFKNFLTKIHYLSKVLLHSK